MEYRRKNSALTILIGANELQIKALRQVACNKYYEAAVKANINIPDDYYMKWWNCVPNDVAQSDA